MKFWVKSIYAFGASWVGLSIIGRLIAINDLFIALYLCAMLGTIMSFVIYQIWEIVSEKYRLEKKVCDYGKALLDQQIHIAELEFKLKKYEG